MDLEKKQVYLDMEAEDKVRYASEMQVSKPSTLNSKP